MTYKINTTDGSLLVEIPDGTVDTSVSSITLIGKNSTQFGEFINENFIKILENFSSTSPPDNPIKGQLWYNSVTARLHVYDGTTFRASGSPLISPVQPLNMIAGDIWINNETNQVRFYDGNDYILTGPIYTAQQGISGFEIQTVLDTFDRSHTICILRVADTLLGIFSKTEFTPRVPIEGYGPDKTVIRIGFNASTVTNIQFNTIASVAEKLVYFDTTKTAEDFAVKSDESGNVFQGPITIQHNGGLELGNSQSMIYLDNNNLKIEQLTSNKDISIKIKSGLDSEDAITIKGQTKKIGVFNDNPQTELDVNGSLTISGDLIVHGEMTTINSSIMEIVDKNIVLGVGVTTAATAKDGGIILKGDTDKTILYNDLNNGVWDLSENINIPENKEYRINNSVVLSATSLGPSVINSQLKNLGQLTTIQMDAGLNITNNEITVSSGNLTLNPAGNVDVSNTKIINVSDPVDLTDATNKQYVNTSVYNKAMSLSLDITGIGTNAEIAAILDEILPFYNETTAPTGVATNSTVLRLHSTKMKVENSIVSAPVLNKTYIAVDKNGITESQPVIQDVVATDMDEPDVTITVTRQNKLFIMTNGHWLFSHDLNEPYTTTVLYPK